jgi:hypothetical protein
MSFALLEMKNPCPEAVSMQVTPSDVAMQVTPS